MAFNPLGLHLLLLFLPCLSAQNNVSVSVGKTLIAGNRDAQWLSPSRDFAFGFYQLGNGLFLLAIWYNKIPSRTVIWFANGDNLAPQGSKLELDEYHGLVLSSPHDQELWKSQSLSGRISFGLMNNTGNFQLLNQNSEVLWESFKHPSDTLVPAQTLELNGILSSRRSETNFSKGKFQFRLDADGDVKMNPINFPSNHAYGPYYLSNTKDANNSENSGSRVVFDELGYLYILRRNGEKVNMTFLSDVRPVDQYYYKATINYDGVFTVSYHPKDSTADSQNWTVSKPIPENICIYGDYFGSGICGYNSICTRQIDGRPKCKCLDGYSFVDATDELSTCLPDFELDCPVKEDNSKEDLYYMKELLNTNFPNGDAEVYNPSTYEECQNLCLKDCRCSVAIWGGGCWINKLPLSNGIYDMIERGTTLVKLLKNNNVSGRIPDNGMQCPSDKTNTKDQDIKIKVIAILLGSSFFFNIMLVAAICIAFFFKFHKRVRVNKTVAVNESNLRSFTYQELVKATGNFKNELGRGSCGIVYKGEMEMSQFTSLAVKKLDKILQESDKEFKAEVSIIGQTHHKNLVRLLGYCDEGQHRILVYEFLSNGTLSSFLFGELKPSWNQRIHIAFGIARGLFYLHEECSTQIIHCDIKPQNILLDEYYNAKISDFGLAKLLLINQSHTNTTIRGTKGYVAPEWFRSASVTAKVDVYSFGVLLLEIICCRKNVDVRIDNQEMGILTDWAYDCYKAGRLDILIGEDNEAINDMERFEMFVMVAIWCLQEDPSVRPTMKKAMLMLEGIAGVAIPPSLYPYTSIRSN